MVDVATENMAGHDLPVDILGRQEFIDRLSGLLETLTGAKSPCTLALNGKWGSGKSYVLTMLEHQLGIFHGGEKYLMFHYNCWQYDYYEEPLLALVVAMLDNIDEQSNLFSSGYREKATQALAAMGKVLKKIAVDTIEKKFNVDIGAVSELYGEIKGGREETVKKCDEQHRYDHYYTFKQVLNSMKKQLRVLTEDQPLVVIVDELDRCLPDYAIRILERLHHLLSDIDNIIVILAIDREQLDHAVQQIFGTRVDTETYLKKFINLEINLDAGNVNENFTKKYQDYLALFDGHMLESCLSVNEYFSTLFSQMPIRTQERIMEKAATIHRLLFDGCKKDYSFLCFELLMAVHSHLRLEGMPFRFKAFSSPKSISVDKGLPLAFSTYVCESYDGNHMSVQQNPSGNRIQIGASAGILEWIVFYAEVIYVGNSEVYEIAEDVPRREEMTAYIDDFRKVLQLLELIK